MVKTNKPTAQQSKENLANAHLTINIKQQNN